MSALAQLKEHLATIADLDAAAALLGWDQETYMPPGAIEARAAQLTTLARMSHEAFTDETVGRLLDEATASLGDAPYDSDDASLVRVTRRDWQRATKIPADLVARIARATSLGQQAWQKAREASRFEDFAAHLEEILSLSREKAEALGYDERIYDPLLTEFEPGMSTTQLETIFGDLREQLVPIVEALSPPKRTAPAHHAPRPLDRRFDDQGQWDFGIKLMEDFGFDFERGRQDRSAHPFTTAFAATDVRVTTRIRETSSPPACSARCTSAATGSTSRASRRSSPARPSPVVLPLACTSRNHACGRSWWGAAANSGTITTRCCAGRFRASSATSPSTSFMPLPTQCAPALSVSRPTRLPTTCTSCCVSSSKRTCWREASRWPICRRRGTPA